MNQKYDMQCIGFSIPIEIQPTRIVILKQKWEKKRNCLYLFVDHFCRVLFLAELRNREKYVGINKARVRYCDILKKKKIKGKITCKIYKVNWMFVNGYRFRFVLLLLAIDRCYDGVVWKIVNLKQTAIWANGLEGNKLLLIGINSNKLSLVIIELK